MKYLFRDVYMIPLFCDSAVKNKGMFSKIIFRLFFTYCDLRSTDSSSFTQGYSLSV